MRASIGVLILILIIVVGFFVYRNSSTFSLPEGETTVVEKTPSIKQAESDDNTSEAHETSSDGERIKRGKSTRQVFVTDGTRHSIPLNEILSGGVPKDGIPSIDNPKFVSTKKADVWLDDDGVGLGVEHSGETRFYPYRILVWHEIVNDTVGGTPLLVTYCPLCATGVVFERRVNGIEQEFGVSGLLWQSNLLMYNRTGEMETESLWSQVLGEAVLGPQTGERLTIVSADTVRYGDWKRTHPDTEVLSQDTGALRTYGRDPYGDYYTDDSAVSFGATFTDNRLPAKAFVLGVELDGKFKAYHSEALPEGTITDTFAGQTITIERDSIGGVRMFIGSSPLPYIGGFWFSWVAVHPSTELFK